MPNGVIWGGAVDGSNQLGAMVTCQAMVTWPEGCCEAAGTVATRTATAVRSERTIERRQGRIADWITMFLPCVTAAYRWPREWRRRPLASSARPLKPDTRVRIHLEVHALQIETNVEGWRTGPPARYLSGLTCASQSPKCGFIVMTRPPFSS